MDADRVKQRGCEGAGQARDRQTEGDWEQAWREDAGMIVEREQNSQPDALIFDILDKNEDIGSERNRFLRKKARHECNVVLLQESFTAEK